MSRQHGKDTRVYLGGRDASGDLYEIEPKFAASLHDVTNFASADWIEQDGGLLSWELSFNGFYDSAAGGYGLQMEGLGNNFVTSIYTGDADAIGDVGMVFPAGILETHEWPIGVTDMVKVGGTLKGSGRAGVHAVLLHPLGAETATGTESSHDSTIVAGTAYGGRGNLHVTAITGTWTIKIQDSANNVDWDDLISFTQVTEAGGVTAESKTATGTVNRYLRVTSTEDVAGTITFVCGFARYALV